MAEDDFDDEREGIEDLGDPVRELRELREPASPGLLARVLRSVRRRSLGAQLATLGWTALGEVFLELAKLVHALFQSDTTRGDGR